MANKKIQELQNALNEAKSEILSLKVLSEFNNKSTCNKSTMTSTVKQADISTMTMASPEVTTIVSKSEDSKSSEDFCDNILLFRAYGKFHVLSNFAKSPFYFRKIRYLSAEQAYQHQKALFLRELKVANAILKCKNASHAKSMVKNLQTTAEWANMKVNLMLDILRCKVSQCDKFKKALMNTQKATLVHNVESDSFWGCGINAKGQNKLGLLLELLRSEQCASSSVSLSNTESESQNSSVIAIDTVDSNVPASVDTVDIGSSVQDVSIPTTVTVGSPVRNIPVITKQSTALSTSNMVYPSKRKLLVVSDSMLRRIQVHLSEDTDNHVVCLPGADVQVVADKAVQLCQQYNVDYLFIHAGTNNLEIDDFSTVQFKFRRCLEYINWCSPHTVIFLSGILCRQDKFWLNSRIHAVNGFLSDQIICGVSTIFLC